MMNLKFKVFAFLCCIMVTTCKDEQKNAVVVKAQTEAVKAPNKLVFEIDFKTSEPDDFIFFASNVFLNNNQFMNVNITQKLHMNETEKKMHFEFPDNIKPDRQVGLVLGRKLVKLVKVKGIMISYGETKFNINPSELNEYFTFNQFIEYKPETGELITNKIDGKFDPKMVLKNGIIEKLY